MNIEPTNEADVVCKDLIGEAYEAAYKRYPNFKGLLITFSGLDALWADIQKALKMDMCTTADEDYEGKDLIGEAFEQACTDAEQEGCPYCGKQFPVLANIDLDVLWEKVMKVIGVTV